MSDLQPATSDPYENYTMPIEGFKGTPEEIEKQWYEQCYKGRGDSIPQLTLRAELMGSLLGGVLSLTNLYIGLKSGWGFGVAITACILSFAIWNGLMAIRVARRPMSILENNCMQSTASAAGYSTGGTLISAFAALILINNETMPLGIMMLWVFFLAVLGVTMAVPMKRTMINAEQLRFPSGIAAAETLRALHATGRKGARAAKSLLISGGLAAIAVFWKEGIHVFGKTAEGYQTDNLMERANRFVLGKLPVGDMHWVDRTVMVPFDPIFIAGGMIMGLRAALSVLLGAVLCWIVYLPIVQAHVPEAHEAEGYRQIVQWTLWGGVACMVTSSLLSVALQWRSVARAFSGFGTMFGGKKRAVDDPLAALETPTSWFIYGQVFSLIGLAYLGHYSFAIPYWQSALAVVMSFGIALVACRVTGETDTTPIGPMGKIMQLTFGGLAPGNMNVNIMSANIAAGAATSSADLLTDLKSGYLLGANPRKQFLAQFAGIFIGTLVTCLTFSVLVTSASSIGNDQFPAPAAQTWKGVAEAMSLGLSHLHPVKAWSMLIGGLVGIALPLLSRALKDKGHYVPSAAGLGLAWTFHFHFGLSFGIGAIVAWFWFKKNKESSDEFLFPVASGIVAGGALMGVGLIFYENGREMISRLFGG
ncbi:MAG TPA: OPT family oligopeptide transporter [Kofleriaceae bacterium]|nr:OPT family oligopeptide transporter [Kofleriaceae bacterium]